ncbi:MAG: phospholipid carrier-dependent glycosyltransferase [bacterium]|nr:phospholipid carrier-dependent glycosyltransferase [bacterium]
MGFKTQSARGGRVVKFSPQHFVRDGAEVPCPPSACAEGVSRREILPEAPTIMQNKTKLYTGLTLGVITVLNIGLHVWRIEYPARPVFDEAHFVTYASDYLKRRAFIDIHPPLGKLIYADAIALTNSNLPKAINNTDFVLIKASDTMQFSIMSANIPYGSFPYVPLRLVGGFFGVALATSMYFFMRSMGAGRIASLLTSLFITLENAMLLETRLILLNGMYLSFGMLALMLFFKRKSYPFAGGLLWGLSLGVKLLGLAFAGPIFAYHFFAKSTGAGKRALTFLITGCAIFGVIWFTNGFFYTPEARLDFWQYLGFLRPASSSQTVAVPESLRRPAMYLAATAQEMLFASSGYLMGVEETKFANHDGSPWYLWPAMYRKMYYYVPALPIGGALILQGNPAVWLGGTLAVLVALFYIAQRSYRKMREKKLEMSEHERTLLVLLGGYVASLILFITIVQRVTFLYHYFPALLFSIALLGFGIERLLGLKDGEPVSRPKRWALAVICASAVGGFLYMMPGTFGLL